MRGCSAEDDFAAPGFKFFDLLDDLFFEFLTRKWSDFGFFHFIDVVFDKFLGDFFDDNESFSGHTALTGVDESCLHANFCGICDVGVFKNDVSITASEF
ncbi:hypothetical protein D3C87_1551070 [compost metagenome]